MDLMIEERVRLPAALGRQFASGLVTTNARGVAAQTGEFCTVLEAVSAAFHKMFGQGAETLRFPPVMARRDLDRIGYFRNFPQLLGSVHCFCGDENAHQHLLASNQPYSALDAPSDLVLTPAACYPVYPMLAARGRGPDAGYRVEVRSYCFRREPSDDPARLQSFQMQEIVRVGSAEQALEAKAAWIETAVRLFRAWELPAEIVDANDPFFGRAGAVLRKGQKSQSLKHELVVPVNDDGPATACMSFNYHTDHFGHLLSIESVSGAPAHTACVGIGLERATLALFRWHGLELSNWPSAVVHALRLG